MGRTKRRRNKKKTLVGDESQSYNNQSGCCMNSLLKFMGSKGFSSKSLRVANFTETGRGMMALKTFNEGDVLISLPKHLLIGVKQAMRASSWTLDLSKFCTNLSSMQILCVFLLEGKYRLSNGETFCFSSYIKSLPEKFNHHIFWSDDMLCCLPTFVRKKAKLIHEKVWEDFVHLKNSIPLKHLMIKHISWEMYRWAWCCVNSRCIYSDHEKLPDWKFLAPSVADYYYLAPYLDMFNHSPASKVVGFYSQKSQSYEIKSLQKWRKYEQIFICYGPHSTESLFLEYGFVCPGENINDVTVIPKSILYNCDNRTLCHLCMKSFDNFLQTQRLTEGWHMERGKISFNAKTSIALYTALLSKCNARHSHPHILTKQCLISTLLIIQNGKIPEHMKTQVEIAQSNLCAAMCDIFKNDLSTAKCMIQNRQLCNMSLELCIIENLFKTFLLNVSTAKNEYHVHLFQ